MTGQQALVKLQSLDDRDFTRSKANEFISKLADKIPFDKLGGKYGRNEFENQMTSLFETTKTVAGKVVHIGRIIIFKLYDFIIENPHMALGALIGVVLGSFLNMISLVGQILASLAVFLGTSVGAYLDALRSGEAQKADNLIEKILIGTGHAIIEFKNLIKEIFAALQEA